MSNDSIDGLTTNTTPLSTKAPEGKPITDSGSRWNRFLVTTNKPLPHQTSNLSSSRTSTGIAIGVPRLLNTRACGLAMGVAFLGSLFTVINAQETTTLGSHFPDTSNFWIVIVGIIGFVTTCLTCGYIYLKINERCCPEFRTIEPLIPKGIEPDNNRNEYPPFLHGCYRAGYSFRNRGYQGPYS